MKYTENDYIAISSNYEIFCDENLINVKDKKRNHTYVVSPIMGFVFQLMTGENKVIEIIEMMRSVFGREFDLVPYVKRIDDFFGDFIIIRDKRIPETECASICVPDIRKVKPIYFDMLLANRLDGPETVVYNVTNSCDFSCVYCHNEKNKSTSKNYYVSEKTLIDFFQQASAKGCKKVVLTGGDPLSHPNIFKIIKIIKENKISTFLSTKTPLNKEVLNRLSLSGLDEIQYSVDSIDDNVLKLLNIRSCSKDIIHSLKSIKDIFIKYQIKCVITSINIHTIPNLLETCLSIGIKHVGFNLYQGSDYKLIPSHNSLKNLIVEFEKFKKCGMKLEYKFEDKPHICGSLVHTLYLNENGDVSYCFNGHASKEMHIGNIAQQPLSAIWNSEKAFKFLMPNRDLFANTKCEKCSKFEKCIYYGCYYDRLIYSGTPFGELQECMF